jgi:hypothetical protein
MMSISGSDCKQKTRLIYSNGFIIYVYLVHNIITSHERGRNDDVDAINWCTCSLIMMQTYAKK